ncbi:MAG: VRR-NUC domain-containing protein [Anaeroplasmataceae bacterium]|nr:VRR-NUC domain-containing protein [Anaeroplasmataceae bacterium]
MTYVPHKEKEIENEIKTYITAHGGLCYKIHGGDPYQETGIPDLLVCWKGLFFGIEVKDPKGKPSPIQLAQGARIKKAGGHFLIAKSLQDVKDYIRMVRL